MQLILNTFGTSLRKQDGMFLIMANEKKALLSPEKVDSILLATGVHLSTDVIRLAIEHHIDIVLLDSVGEPYGRFWHGRPGSTAALRRAQLEASFREEGVLLAREWVTIKLNHQASMLRELARNRPDRIDALEQQALKIDRMVVSVEATRATVLDELRGTLMGLEGVAGREYFSGLSLALPQRYRFSGRSRSPAKDEFNCLLNYAYGVLYGLVERACMISGLDPYIGLLHTDNYNKLSLVFDLVELFRVHAERVCINLFAARKINPELFDQKDTGFRLNKEGRTQLLQSLNDYLDRKHRHGRRNLKIRDTIPYECQRLAGRLLKGIDTDPDIDLEVFDFDANAQPAAPETRNDTAEQ